MNRSLLKVGAITLPLIIFSSCATTPDSDVVQFVDQTLNEKTEKITLLSEPPLPASITYTGSDLRNPFEVAQTEAPGKPALAVQEAQKAQNAPKEKVQQESKLPPHPKELLENFPLDSLKMVGILEKNGATWGLIQDNSGILYRVGIGRYIGQNIGKIVKITAGGIEILETIPDGEGGWRERTAALRLSQ